jgi:broad specificity phosphatase PhoE
MKDKPSKPSIAGFEAKPLPSKRVDRIRGSVDLPLTPKGLSDVKQLASKIASKGSIHSITSSDLQRTQQTAQAISKASGVPVTTTKNTRDIAYGSLEGKPSKDAIGEINKRITEKPDERFPGKSSYSSEQGESFNQYKNRLLPEIEKKMDALDANKDEKHLMVVNRRSIKTIEGWVKQGAPANHDTDAKTVTSFGDDTEPGSIHHLSRDKDGKWQLKDVDGLKGEDKLKGGIYFIRHGETEWNGN